ncbi:hypothetical protein RRH01S_06_00390 [Rhizobium rhizogenes NBRC 13257]|uniref:Uncharacterized protein n=1 Tax=Rhizobium rhizogenes NBRC 13257 TaxID=1220581 RepID=A0AA87Q0Y2_RHIRH|nr:hypothetical protein RRH01S_06_00390 [Rhizobium rhizogenes NBRC 13257]
MCLTRPPHACFSLFCMETAPPTAPQDRFGYAAREAIDEKIGWAADSAGHEPALPLALQSVIPTT